MSREKSCFGFLFSVSIVVGIVFGFIIRNGMDSDPTITPPPPDPEDTILIVGVESLEGNTHNLEGVWLVKLDAESDLEENNIHLILQTLYPLLPENVNALELRKYANPHPPIQIDPDDIEALKKFPPIALSGETWRHVIFLDEIAMNTVILLNNVNFSGEIKPPSSETFLKPWEDPEESYQQQWSIISTLCEEPEAYGQFSTIQKIVQLYGKHIHSKLQEQGLYQLWQTVNLRQGSELSCEIYPDLSH